MSTFSWPKLRLMPTILPGLQTGPTRWLTCQWLMRRRLLRERLTKPFCSAAAFRPPKGPVALPTLP